MDESWASTNMARRYGRCRRGERLRMSVPHGHYKTTTFIAGLRNSGIVAPFVIDRPVNRTILEAWVERVLVPNLGQGDIVVMDNLSSHKGPRVRALIEAAGATLRYLPPYSPTSTRSRRPLPSSRLSCAKRPHAPSMRFGPPSGASSTSLLPQNASTCLPQLAMIQTDRTPL